jgi:uncharacterized protein (DUF2249 family)
LIIFAGHSALAVVPADEAFRSLFSWIILVIVADGRPLPIRYDLRNHSPDGGEWGYHGSGPAQLSLALLAGTTDDDGLAQRF